MISAVLITLNEQKNIRKALTSLKGLADEVIIADSGSRDNTLKIAREFNTEIYFRKFDNFANQKNFALSKATNEWVLALDADEEIPSVLAEEIRKAVKNEQYSGYLIPRRNFIFGTEIKYSRWSPDAHIWLWKKNSGKWVGDVHEEVKIAGKVGLLKSSKIHNSHQTLSSFFRANNLYSDLEAQSLYKKNIRFSFLKMFLTPIFEFILRFFYKRGFLDGKIGFALSFAMGIYKLSVWIKLWELEKKK
ncbi:hypothetical protein A3J19_05465 [Candidatus Daviesbacteria bacterium RIFCSPLOWO2_02_FULL_41_8]|uniref:Glycosyltransferase 2-like domain-containing protein n=3 Tax=Candidatus Daviesiibacteriota TaxID=1752718 RepID=A0A1F5NIW0_9BACT|nr:MAG: hypothetical protein A2871_03640 [Candidatus Daviesbacteria bacterium RIFCSPHIGHO2_01_FULL_41_23]OGE32491.1 MAG: hypothetical protein A3D83_02485 [Candidatus Daviesbacteria bacterium RIFCSPHIGHO2_02_FULL_41_10]OGE62012.1 MAG: hypothetical protein A2967_03455 [Candidatus Daviesbacteria bacterium RIFCSPLOWO2_01_FULL_41_32]OGE77360.1 MAG: hypothetical protein A3J19_05465 [Candidatus Daviesbacteria bacterium RIFCSPLOWO2_02_FULL_41_8]